MEFRLLGPVEAIAPEGKVPISASKLRTALAMLLLHRGRVVPDFRLAEMLWGEHPPNTADAQIHTYMSRLRQRLGSTEIERLRPGYVLRIRPEQLDLVQFETLAAEGRAALTAGRFADARTALRSALDVWHGPALSGVTDHLGAVERPELEEARLTALEDRVEAELSLGLHTDLLPELTGLVAVNPLRERLRGQLMLGLYRSGRQPDALAAFHDYRTVLADELGIDPSAALQGLHQQVLTNASGLDSSAPAPVVRASASPAQLAPDISDFTGRRVELTAVLSALTTAELPLCVLTGMGGVGKTTLALHAAHRCRDRFPDGQIHVDLNAGDRAVEPFDALAVVLRSLGVEDLPASMADRLALYRSKLATRRVLLFLDNADGAGQIRPLLPGYPGSGVLVTSRTRLAALEGGVQLDLDVLPEADVLELLGTIVGRRRVTAELADAERLVRLCGNLPLGVRIVGARLAAKPHWRLAHLADRLANRFSRLDELRLGDLQVRASVERSYLALAATTRRAFRLLALLNARHFAVWTASLVLDVPLVVARELVEQLVDARLLQVRKSDDGQARYFFHDLVRAHALERVGAEETACERSLALHRALAIG